MPLVAGWFQHTSSSYPQKEQPLAPWSLLDGALPGEPQLLLVRLCYAVLADAKADRTPQASPSLLAAGLPALVPHPTPQPTASSEGTEGSSGLVQPWAVCRSVQCALLCHVGIVRKTQFTDVGKNQAEPSRVLGAAGKAFVLPEATILLP